MPCFARTQRRYQESMLRSTANPLLLLLLLLLYCQGVSTETNSSAAAKTPRFSTHLKGQSHVEEHVILKRQNTELSCNVTDVPNMPPNITAFWLKDGLNITQDTQTVQRENKQYVLKQNFQISTIGNYSCVFSHLQWEVKATFVFKVPEMKETRLKPTVSYIGDSVVLLCKFEKYYAKTWEWFKMNGTKKESINDTAGKYEINRKNQTISKLTVLNLKEEDSGDYICRAVFEVGVTETQVPLKVLSFSEPLKPFIAIAIEVVVLVTIILLYEKTSKGRRAEHVVTENGPQSEHAGKLAEDETNGMDGASTTRQRKVEN